MRWIVINQQCETLSIQAIKSGLGTRYVGQNVHYWPSIGSTNDELKRLAEQDAPEGTLAIADRQTAGRGRMDRRWDAPAGSSLLMSLLFRPVFLSTTQAQQMTMICSLATADAVAEVTGLETKPKWPNDLLLDGRKVTGILTELGFEEPAQPTSVSQPDDPLNRTVLAWIVVGIGLNVNIDFTEWPELSSTATSLAMALGKPVDRLPLLQVFLRGVESRYDALRAGHSPHNEWSDRLTTLGKAVTVTTSTGVYEGIAEGVSQTGELLLRLADGQLKHILSADVTLRGGGT